MLLEQNVLVTISVGISLISVLLIWAFFIVLGFEYEQRSVWNGESPFPVERDWRGDLLSVYLIYYFKVATKMEGICDIILRWMFHFLALATWITFIYLDDAFLAFGWSCMWGGVWFGYTFPHLVVKPKVE